MGNRKKSNWASPKLTWEIRNQYTAISPLRPGRTSSSRQVKDNIRKFTAVNHYVRSYKTKTIKTSRVRKTAGCGHSLPPENDEVRSPGKSRAALSRFSMALLTKYLSKRWLEKSEIKEGQLTLVFDRWGQKQGCALPTRHLWSYRSCSERHPFSSLTLWRRASTKLFSQPMWFFFLSQTLPAFFNRKSSTLQDAFSSIPA